MSNTNEIKKDLIFIAIDKLHPHPDNPRKNLGDLSELTESIKLKGVMQNLTVVPANDGYTVIIGHRRLEASKIAGLTELPCIVENLTPQEQIQTMLLENLLREDLTIYEQAQGFQMMLDFGDSIDQISEKTGFSKTTVRRRVKLAELNNETFRSVSERQFSFADIDRLSQIEDMEVRNAVFAEIGTKNFENRFLDAMNKQKQAKKKAGWEQIFKDKGLEEIPYNKCFGAEYVSPDNSGGYLTGEPEESDVDKLLECGEQLYYAWGYNDLPYIRKKKVISEDEAKEQEAEAKRRAENAARYERLKDISKKAFELRRNFIKDISFTACKKNTNQISEWACTREIAAFACSNWFAGYSTSVCGAEMFKFLFGIDDLNNAKYSLIKEYVEKHPEKSLLLHTYALWCDSENTNCMDYDHSYKANAKLQAIYDGLVRFGYEISDEEQAMLDGTLSDYSESDNEDLTEDEYEDEEISDDDFDEELAEMMDDEE